MADPLVAIRSLVRSPSLVRAQVALAGDPTTRTDLLSTHGTSRVTLWRALTDLEELDRRGERPEPHQ